MLLKHKVSSSYNHWKIFVSCSDAANRWFISNNVESQTKRMSGVGIIPPQVCRAFPFSLSMFCYLFLQPSVEDPLNGSSTTPPSSVFSDEVASCPVAQGITGDVKQYWKWCLPPLSTQAVTTSS